MIVVPEIEDYIAYMKSHSQWINRDRWLLAQNVIRPLLNRSDVYFNDKQFRDCIAFAEANYYSLFLVQKFLYAMQFFYYTKDDEPVFPESLIMMGRGGGKDAIIAPLSNYFLTPLYGISQYHIDIVANAEDVSKDTFLLVHDAMDKPRWKSKFRVTLEEVKNLKTKSRLRYNTARGETKYGKKTGMVVFNELHTYIDYSQIGVFTSGLGKVKNPRTIYITTNGYIREGPLDDKLAQARQILDGGENKIGLFPFICRLDDISEAGDFDAMHKANPTMEYLPTLERKIMQDYTAAQENPKLWAEYVTMRCNLPEEKPGEQQVATIPEILRCSYTGSTLEELEKREPRPVPDTKGQPAIIGIDYADVRDFMSCGVLTKAGDDYVWTQHTWANKRNPRFREIRFPLEGSCGAPGYQDYEIVDASSLPVDSLCDYVDTLLQIFDVKAICLDTYRWQVLKTAFEARGWYECSRDTPWGIVHLIRRVSAISTIMGPLLMQNLSDGHIIYGDSAIMRWYTSNTGFITDKNGNTVFVKIEERTRKTDGFMAMVVAFFMKDSLEELVFYV